MKYNGKKFSQGEIPGHEVYYHPGDDGQHVLVCTETGYLLFKVPDNTNLENVEINGSTVTINGEPIHTVRFAEEAWK